MKTLQLFAKPLSAIGLALIIITPVLFFTGTLDSKQMNALLLAGTLAWFISAPFWVKSDTDREAHRKDDVSI